MTKPVTAALPAEYNVYVQHLLEGYATLEETLRHTENLLAEERETKRRSIDEFTKVINDWEQREADYKAEIRRMEVLLAKSVPEGVGAVVLARSGSIVDRSLAGSKQFQASVTRAMCEAVAGRFTTTWQHLTKAHILHRIRTG